MSKADTKSCPMRFTVMGFLPGPEEGQGLSLSIKALN